MLACECGTKLQELNGWIGGRNPVGFTDIDKTQRWDKNDIRGENKRAIKKFRKKGGLLIPITGAPLCHIPQVFHKSIMFGESGGAMMLPDNRIVELVPEAGKEAMWELRQLLGITVSEGMDRIGTTTVLMEGPRYVSLTLLPKFTFEAEQQAGYDTAI